MQTVTELFENLNTEGLSSYQVYNFYLSNLIKSGKVFPTIYMSCALTSGGFRRDPSVKFFDGIDKNSKLARLIIEALDTKDLLDKDTIIIFPGDTTSPEEGWNQLDFNILFGLMILGIQKPEDAQLIDEYVRANIDMSGFLNKEASRAERLASYQSLVDLIEKVVRENYIKVEPVKKIIELLDTDMSLGAWYESEIAKRFGARIFRVQINQDVATEDENLQEIINQINLIKSVDNTFNFFESGPKQDLPIYFVEP